MALPFVPSKRPFERHLMEPNGRGKWQKTSHSTAQSSQFKAPSGSAVFRVLCPSSKSGSVIGKGGGIIGKIRHETGAKIKLEDSVSGCDERVVVISGSAKDYELKSESMKHNDSEHNAEVVEDGKANLGENKDKEGFSVTDDSKLANATSLVQKALILIFERIIEGETVIDDGDEANKKFPSFRLLVFSNQVGCLLGKGGSVIKQMSTDSGAQIRILPRDKLPLCASQHDDIVQIVGGIDSIRKALQSVSQLLLENPPRERDFSSDNPPGTSHSHAPPPRQEAFNPTNYHKTAQGPPFSNKQPYDAPDLSSFPKFHEGPLPGQIPVTPDVLVFRLLCSNDKVGSVIGKAGNIVKALQHETGCEIKVLEIPSETEDRIIVISGPALPGDRVSPPQDALLRVQQRILMAVPDNKDNFVLSRMLVSSNQIGCLLGKGGSIITEMRKLSGAHIRVMSKDQIPKGVSENDEMVQVSGEFGAVREALLQITARLRGHLFRDKVPALNNPPHAPFIDQMPPFGSYMGRREPSPPRLYGVLPPFPKDAGAHAHEERPAFPHAILGPGVALGADRVLPTSWAPQGMREGGGSMPIPDFGVAPSRNIGGFPGGNQSAVISHTTVDVVVPRALVPSIYGEDGGCLRRIREISEAKITITDPRPEAKETVILISGTPEQMHAAQSLIQAFVLSETTMP